jgi:EAL domain-containing protein (putative c-di-GMP-specific phosphodiesterase class I)
VPITLRGTARTDFASCTYSPTRGEAQPRLRNVIALTFPLEVAGPPKDSLPVRPLANQLRRSVPAQLVSSPQIVLTDADIVLGRLTASRKRCNVAEKSTDPSTAGGENPAQDLAQDLALALEADQFFLMYQPTIDLQTNAFVSVEALIRWQHPVRGVVNPETFIPLLESSGQIVAVGRWALATACAQGAVWHAKGYRFAVSVNISPKQFERDDFSEDVASALAFNRFDPAQLVLEFARETLTSDVQGATRRLTPLKALGVRLAVDDLAPGDSPFEDLERLPIDVVKLDKDFVAGISNDEVAKQIRSLVQLARTLRVQIFASGVEDAEQVKRLQIEEVDIGQGFFFSMPHEAIDIDRFLEDFAIFSGKPL